MHLRDYQSVLAARKTLQIQQENQKKQIKQRSEMTLLEIINCTPKFFIFIDRNNVNATKYFKLKNHSFPQILVFKSSS